MTLQRRLTLFFILIVILPLAIAGYVVQRVVVGEIAERARLALDPALDATVALYNERVDGVDERVQAAVDRVAFAELLQRDDPAALASFLDQLVEQGDGIDFLLVKDPTGKIVASSVARGSFVRGFEPPSAAEIAAARSGTGPGFVRSAEIPVLIAGEGEQATVSGGFWVDQQLLVAARARDVDLSIAVDGRIIASTLPLRKVIDLDVDHKETFETNITEAGTARATRLTPQGMSLVAFTPNAPIESISRGVLTSMLGLLAVALLGTSVLAYLLARPISQPLEELAERAKAIAEGRFEEDIPVRTRDEVGLLAAAFNDMTHRLRDTITQLSESRDQLQRTIRRVGETLRSTHDMRQVLQSIVNTASDAIEADAAILWMLTATRDSLYPALTHGLDSRTVSRVAVGEGIVGLVAERAARVVSPTDGGGPRAARTEPDFPVVIGVPVYSQDRITAVLTMYRKDPEKVFSPGDVDTVMFLAEQGGVGIENVLLHEEAQRLSLTDGLTGIWNRRYFQMQFRQVLATAMRFQRPFSLLMLDLDRFKAINDTYGHQRGDAILVEFAQRVSRVLREVDTFARYGGEEFICLLSETDLFGAMTTADKILDAIRSEPFGNIDEQVLRLTVSIGVSSYPDHGDSFRALVEAADQALYQAKKGGRDRACAAEKPTSGLKIAR